jgi:hypothetical protein
VPIQFTPCQPFFDTVVANSDAFYYNTLVIFCFIQFSLNKIQDILLTNHGANKELNNHNIYNIHNWIDLNTHNLKTIDKINIHKKQTHHDIKKETTNKKIGNMFYVAGGRGGNSINL